MRDWCTRCGDVKACSHGKWGKDAPQTAQKGLERPERASEEDTDSGDMLQDE